MIATRKKKNLPRKSTSTSRLRFRLYVDSTDIRSWRAIDDLTTICCEHFGNDYRIEIVDARKELGRARRNKITTTPTLVKLAPKPTWRIEGDLREDAMVLAVMKGKRKQRASS